MVWDIFLVSLDQLSQLCLLPVYSLRGKSKEQKELMLCKQCSASAKSSLYYQQFLGHQSKTQHHTSRYEENQLHLSQIL